MRYKKFANKAEEGHQIQLHKLLLSTTHELRLHLDQFVSERWQGPCQG